MIDRRRGAARSRLLLTLVAGLALGVSPRGQSVTPVAPVLTVTPDTSRPDFARQLRDQADTDRHWAEASDGFMRMEKITYRSSLGDLDIPAFVFQPLTDAAPQSRAALVWVHENIRGHVYEHYIPYIRDAVARGLVVIAPEYRGSIGYGRRFYNAIDYGGAEVDDVVTAARVVAERYPSVDPARVGIIGWSHGGLITLLAIFRNPTTFHAAAAMVPVTNLFHRLARKGVELQRREIDPQNRFGGSPSEKPDVYEARSPLFHVDQLQIPLLVHVADNDQDVEFDEAVQLVDALHARKPALADVKVYHNPTGGHMFDRLVTPQGVPENSPEQRDSWSRVWQFFDDTLALSPQ
ncbi:MAG: prolyl oligopeptidase family serine peptidase [Acidobacteriaceae bacterium]|jgi:dipeptidyl aminopeptidase/acylaminoacyl peptidase|nr:prolyl oligopeptidase family serine peptidase [Acidobacteriaceae bacterium]